MFRNTDVVAEARIEPGANFERARVAVRIEGGDEFGTLFRFYDDELRFSSAEFVGKTVRDGLDLFTRKDIAYLQS